VQLWTSIFLLYSNSSTRRSKLPCLQNGGGPIPGRCSPNAPKLPSLHRQIVRNLLLAMLSLNRSLLFSPVFPPGIGREPNFGMQEVSAFTAQPQQPAAGPPAGPKYGPEMTSQTQCSSAFGLNSARIKRKPIPEYTDRRNRMEQHLIDQTSSGKPVRVRDLYQTFRSKGGTEEDSTKMRTVLLDVCGKQEKAFDYLLFSCQPLETICPRGEPKDTQKFIGTATVLGRDLHMYSRLAERKYPRGPRIRKSGNSDDRDGTEG
jgi:hypothetical protein